MFIASYIRNIKYEAAGILVSVIDQSCVNFVHSGILVYLQVKCVMTQDGINQSLFSTL